jgi:hypothetical protein
MGRFPKGGWDIADCEDLTTWSKELQTLDPSKELRQIVVSLLSLAAQILDIATPVEMDAELSDEEEVPPLPTTDKSAGTIRVKGRAAVPVRADELPETIENIPSVRPYPID